MSKITIVNLSGKEIYCSGAEKNILDCILRARVDWMHACGGKGRCTTCKMIVMEGYENVSPLTDAEVRWKQSGGLKSNERLTCQCSISGDVSVKVADAYKFPHINYSE